MNLVDDNDRIVEIGGVRTGNGLELLGRDAIVADKLHPIRNHFVDLGHNVVLLGGLEGLEIRLGGGLAEIGNPDDRGASFAVFELVQIVTTEGENGPGVHFIHNEEGRGAVVQHLGQRQGRPEIRRGEMAESARKDDVVHVVGSEGFGRHDDEAFIRIAVQGLGRYDGGAGLARAEAVVDHHSPIGASHAHVLFDELLVQEGLDPTGAAAHEFFAGGRVEFLVLDDGGEAEPFGVGCLDEFVKGGAG